MDSTNDNSNLVLIFVKKLAEALLLRAVEDGVLVGNDEMFAFLLMKMKSKHLSSKALLMDWMEEIDDVGNFHIKAIGFQKSTLKIFYKLYG